MQQQLWITIQLNLEIWTILCMWKILRTVGSRKQVFVQFFCNISQTNFISNSLQLPFVLIGGLKCHLCGCLWLVTPKCWEVVGTYEWYFCSYTNAAWNNQRWWEHSKVCLLLKFFSNFLHSQAAGIQKLRPQALMPRHLCPSALTPTSHLVEFPLPYFFIYSCWIFNIFQFPICTSSVPEGNQMFCKWIETNTTLKKKLFQIGCNSPTFSTPLKFELQKFHYCIRDTRDIMPVI